MNYKALRECKPPPSSHLEFRWKLRYIRIISSSPISVGLLNLAKTFQTTVGLLRFKYFQYGGFDLELWPRPIKT